MIHLKNWVMIGNKEIKKIIRMQILRILMHIFKIFLIFKILIMRIHIK